MRGVSRSRVIGVASLVLLVMTATSCFKKSGKLSDVSPREAMGLLRNDFAILIDLREPTGGMELPDPSVGIPSKRILEGDFEQILRTLPSGKQLLLCCEAPETVSRVARRLNDAGFDVGRVGSLDDWRAAGLPTRK